MIAWTDPQAFAQAWASIRTVRPTNVLEMQEASRLASLHGIDYMDALAMIRRDQYQFDEMIDGMHGD